MDTLIEFDENIKLKPLGTDALSLEKILKKKPGKYTIGDFTSLSGLPMLEAKYAIKELLTKYVGRIYVTEKGDLVYDFGNKLSLRGSISLAERWQQFKSFTWKIFKAFYKVAISIVLVIYFVVFVVILIALLIAAMSGGGNSDNKKGSDGLFRLVGDMFYSIFRYKTHYGDIYRPRDAWGYPYDHYEPHKTHWPKKQYEPSENENPKTKRLKEKSFIASIYDFVFGPPRIQNHPLANQREVASYLQQTKSLISTSEVQALAGWSREEAETFMTDCLTLFDGNAEINDNGTFYGEFYDLTRSTKVQENYPIEFFWDEYEAEWELTGNSTTSNIGIVFMNGFNLAFSAYVITSFFNQAPLILSTPSPFLVCLFLGWIPLLYSVIFFLVPLLRLPGIKRNQKKQHIQNIRKRLMRIIFSRHKEQISLTELTQTANNWRETEEKLDKKVVDKIVRDFIIDMNGEGVVNDEGEILYNFHQLNRELTDLEILRKDRIFDSELGDFVKL